MNLGFLRDAKAMGTAVPFNRRRFLWLVAVALAAIAAAPAYSQIAEAPATILLIRHAEKLTDGRLDLSPAGFERAKVIPLLFSATGPAAQHALPKPDFLFATHVRPHSNRPVETITPLSEALGLPISHEIEDKEFATLAKELLSGRYAGKVVLVAWHHGSLPGLARALGSDSAVRSVAGDAVRPGVAD